MVWTNHSSPGVGVSLYAGLHPDEGLDVGVEAVGHQLELSVGRDEGDCAVVLKPGQSEDSKMFESETFRESQEYEGHLTSRTDGT